MVEGSRSLNKLENPSGPATKGEFLYLTTMLPKGSNKYETYEKDPTLKQWLRNLARGSPITAQVALRRLGKACELLDTNPNGLLKEAKKDLTGLQDSLEIWLLG